MSRKFGGLGPPWLAEGMAEWLGTHRWDGQHLMRWSDTGRGPLGGVYDLGLETLTAKSFVVTDRTPIYTHPATGAETRLGQIVQDQCGRFVRRHIGMAGDGVAGVVKCIGGIGPRAFGREIEPAGILIHPCTAHGARCDLSGGVSNHCEWWTPREIDRHRIVPAL